MTETEARGQTPEEDEGAGDAEEGLAPDAHDDDPAVADEDGAASDELEAFFRELAEAVQAYALYPPGHPLVEPRSSRLLKRLTPLLRSEGAVSIGIGAKQFFSEEFETDPEDAALGSLARRLHAHEISRLTLVPAVDRDEVHEFLTAVAVVPDEEEERLARRPEVWTGWSGIGVETVQYDRITLGEGGDGEGDGDEGDSPTAKLWLGLARAVHPFELDGGDRTEGPEEGEGSTSAGELTPTRLSEELAGTEDEERSSAVAAQLLRIAEELAGASGDPEYEGLRAQLVELVRELSSSGLYRLLRQGTGKDRRRRFLVHSSDWLPTDVLVELIREARESGDVELSQGALGVLSKMAGHATASDLGAGDGSVRDLVREMLAAPDDTEEQPEAYREGLRGLAGTSRFAAGGRGGTRLDDPRVAIEVGLEVDRLGEVGMSAARRMKAQGRLGELTALLAEAPESPVTEELWREVASPQAIAYLLDQRPPDLDAVDRIVDRVGPAAAEPMLDLLETSESRTVRGKLFRFLTRLGPAIADRVADRADDDRWYVQRNVLALLGEIGKQPEGFSARPFTRHPKESVRYEAYKLLLQEGDEGGELLARVLREDSPRFRRLGLVSAEPPLPEQVFDIILDLARNPDVDQDLRALAVRALGPSESREALRTLLDLTLRRRRLLFWWKRLAEPSPVVVEAVRALRTGWSGEEEAEKVLEMAAGADDPALREAAMGEEGGAA